MCQPCCPSLSIGIGLELSVVCTPSLHVIPSIYLAIPEAVKYLKIGL